MTEADTGATSLIGDSGTDGADNLDCTSDDLTYEVWLASDKNGTVTKFLAWMTGQTGDMGDNYDKDNIILKCQKGQYYLDGSEGIDVLVINGGADVFQISKGVDLVEDFSMKQGDRIALDKKGKYTIIDDADGVLIRASAKKQLFLEGVDYDNIIAAGSELFVQIA